MNYDKAYEHETLWFSSPSWCWAGNYNRNSWGSNLPEPYLDTDFEDTGYIDNRAAGSAPPLLLSPSYDYYTFIRMTSSCGGSYPYFLGMQSSYIDFGNPACGLGMAFCVFNDADSPRFLIPHNAGYASGVSYDWVRLNHIQNPGFELISPYWSPRGAGVQWAFYAGGQYDGSRFVQFNCAGTNGAPGCSVYQDIPWSPEPWDEFDASIAIRCNAATSCPITLALWGLGPGVAENVAVVMPAVSAGGWDEIEWRVSGFSAGVTSLRLEVYNMSSSSNIDIDFAGIYWSEHENHY